jgi:hypothetical protein
MSDLPCTALDIEAIRKAAHIRVRFLLWIARQLDARDDAISVEAAAALRQLLEMK